MLFLLFISYAAACPCAELASCVRFPNQSLGCSCPFFGDGYKHCEESLKITSAVHNDSWWRLELPVREGMVFVAAELSPLPCVHVVSPCCASEYLYWPFRVGSVDAETLDGCQLPRTSLSQYLRPRFQSHLQKVNGGFVIHLADDELSMLTKTNGSDSFVYVGVIKQGFASQVEVLLSRDMHPVVTQLRRQVSKQVYMQVEQVGTEFFIKATFSVESNDATVAFLQYAWNDLNWVTPMCEQRPNCLQLNPCSGIVRNDVMKLWVPVENHTLEMGNLSLHVVVQQPSGLTRIFASSEPRAAEVHCVLQEGIELFQGLTMQPVYRGDFRPLLEINTEPESDTLLTLFSTGAHIDSITAIHTRTQSEAFSVLSLQTCETCVEEQLILNGHVVSPRSCFLFGVGSHSAWIQAYIGFNGELARSVIRKIPDSVWLGQKTAVWIHPSWPEANKTFLKVSKVHISRASPREKVELFFLRLIVVALALWHFYQLIFILF
jgi:hypothetical protein